MDFTRRIEANREALANDVDRRVEAALRPFAEALDQWLAALFAAPFPPDWRERWRAFVAEQAASGYFIAEEIARDVEQWVGAWACFCHLLTEQTRGMTVGQSNRDSASRGVNSNASRQVPAAWLYWFGTRAANAFRNRAPMGDWPQPTPDELTDKEFGSFSEDIISELLGIPVNDPPAQRQRIRGTGDVKYRHPDLLFKGPGGSLYRLHAIIEVKASRDPTRSKLNSRSRHQLADNIRYAERLRTKASLVKGTELRAALQDVRAVLYTDFPQPTRGSFQESVQRGALDWRSIPRGTRMLSRLGKSAKLRHLGSPNSSYYPTAPIASRSIGKPGLSAVENIGLGVVISVAEADISNEFYEACSNSLNGLLGQVAENHEAVQSEWDAILQRIEQIKAMKLSLPGRIWSWISSVDVLTVQKGNALMLLAGEIADKHGYVLVTSWSDMVDGRPGFFERRSKETY